MTDRIQSGARALLNVRMTRTPIAALPDPPQTAAEAYAIQDAVIAKLGRIGGWKVGAASPTAEPGCAPLPAAGVVESPRAFASGAFRLNGIEAELAFKLCRDLPPRASPYAADDIVAAVGSVHAAIEVVDSRFTDFRMVDALSQLADFGTHGALVVGAGRATDLRVDQTRQAVTLWFDDTVQANVVGGNAAGDVFRLLAWLANHAAARCGGLRAGQVVTTGSCTGLLFARPGTKVRAALAGIGEAAVEV